MVEIEKFYVKDRAMIPSYFLDVLHRLDALAILMLVLIAYMGACVLGFASRYMKGDSRYRAFLIYLVLLICSVSIMVGTRHLGVLLLAVICADGLWVRLMVHTSNWKAAKASGVWAVKNYLVGVVCLGVACVLFYLETQSFDIDVLIQQGAQSRRIEIALIFLLGSAVAQSALWPCHRWLLSSLNAPTPVSAIMHAGLINSGGFFLLRFAPLYLAYPYLMNALFVIGMCSALLGSLWKLMQSDVKRMLACSTMGQMGFMFVQCGLGMFPLAAAHVLGHALFKAYMFLASGSAPSEPSGTAPSPSILSFVCALLYGAFSGMLYAYASPYVLSSQDSSWVLVTMVVLSGSQLAVTVFRRLNVHSLFLGAVTIIVCMCVYTVSLHNIVSFLEPMHFMHPQPLNSIHKLAIFVWVLLWLGFWVMRSWSAQYAPWMLKAYVKALNSSQPYPDTLTAYRHHYKYQ